MNRVQEIHRRNVLMLKLLWSFYLISLLVNLIVDKSIYVLYPPVGLLLGIGLLVLVASRRVPEFAMFLMVASLYVFLLSLTLKYPYLVNFIFLGLIPLFTLLYLDFRAVLLSGILYLATAIYMFYTLHDEMFAAVERSDIVYIITFGLFSTAFSLFFTKFTKSLWLKAEKTGDQLSSILQNVEIATWSYNLSDGIMRLSEGIVHISGRPLEAFKGDYRILTDIVLPADKPLIMQAQKEMVLDKRSIVTECRIVHQDGEYRWTQIRGNPYFNELGHLERLEGVIIDITERKRLEEQVEYLAYHDELTGLPNRVLFNMRFDQYIHEGTSLLTIMFIDLDNFKEVNDAFGHSAGDLLLKEIAGRLSAHIRDTDMVCRLGGDEFLLLLSHSDARHASKVAERIIASLSSPFHYQGYPLVATPSIGVCVYEGGPCDLDQLIREADEAMYEAKREGRNRYFINSASSGVTSYV
ncbi:PAS domain S-box-containing protein/diguanylate cyclase (GGDEF)-like protein [Fontibacillus phaseoli]|uniref:PAS domain S-box-containing protein/diguanylate cyclase (GGDEF)-like protein n=1 Tax=Fontibacillus phaseoli TaxID=1416533 RepID=A0A369BAK8_9BACL|nr:sensor domain-containing diguanylate cyclase [Fontibacillus phaseoli]RCX16714.1 PAS domain S-box-containing protein/diguanylate cyclase (GGDEF)-like protein [Fontibacillus phaseoli]